MKTWEKLETLCRSLIEGMGYEFVGLEYHHNTVNALLRVYIDVPSATVNADHVESCGENKSTGVSLEQIVEVSEQLSRLLDVEDPIQGHYTLEVSSPGLDRPLFSLEDFQRFQGEKVQLKTRRPLQGRRNFKGVIAEVDLEQQSVFLNLVDGERSSEAEENGDRVAMDYENIERARLAPELSKRGK